MVNFALSGTQICPVLTVSSCAHHRINTPRKQGGLGEMQIPLLADKTAEISRAYGVLKEDAGLSFR